MSVQWGRGSSVCVCVCEMRLRRQVCTVYMYVWYVCVGMHEQCMCMIYVQTFMYSMCVCVRYVYADTCIQCVCMCVRIHMSDVSMQIWVYNVWKRDVCAGIHVQSMCGVLSFHFEVLGMELSFPGFRGKHPCVLSYLSSPQDILFGLTLSTLNLVSWQQLTLLGSSFPASFPLRAWSPCFLPSPHFLESHAPVTDSIIVIIATPMSYPMPAPQEQQGIVCDIQ